MNKSLSIVVVTVALALSAAAAQVSADEPSLESNERRGVVSGAEDDASDRP
ncbi:MAG: hypothetical protein ABIQ60_00390 [Burkholderiaceae bacterium]